MNVIEYEKSKQLWLECFPEDDASFTDFYYSSRSRPEYALGAFEAGSDTPAAMLHMIPVEMRFSGGIKKIAEIAGVCTKPDRRRRGVCTELFGRAFHALRDAGFDAAVLCPFRESFYERLGFKTYIKRQRVELSAKPAPIIGKAEAAPDPRLMHALYSDFTSRFDGCSLRSEEYFIGMIEEYSMSGARLTVAENGCCAGYETDGGDAFEATELFFADGADITRLLPPGYSKYAFPLPPGSPIPENASSETVGFAMIKPISPGFTYDPARCYGFDRY